MRIRVVEPEQLYDVLSDSGNVYHITYAGSGDADPEYVALWECDCPAAQHGQTCKHLKGFLGSRLMDVGDPYYDDDDLPPTLSQEVGS